MKTVLLALATLSSAAFAGEPIIGGSDAAKVLSPLAATVTAVQQKFAPAPAMGMWTEVTITYLVPCTAQLEDFTYNWQFSADASDKIDLFASATVSSVVAPGDLACAAETQVDETITLPPMFGTDQINLINLAGPAKTLDFDFVKISADNHDVKVISAVPLCPPGVMCIVNGTVITLQYENCTAEDSPVFHAVSQTAKQIENGQLDLAVRVLPLEEVVGCTDESPIVHQAQITLINTYADFSGINLLQL